MLPAKGAGDVHSTERFDNSSLASKADLDAVVDLDARIQRCRSERPELASVGLRP